MITRNGLGLVAAMSLLVAACTAGPGSSGVNPVLDISKLSTPQFIQTKVAMG